MKQRCGFVSNSSSSSFLIATKKPLKESDLLGPFATSADSPLYPMVKEMASVLFSSARKYKSIKAYCDEEGFEEEDVSNNIKKYFDTGWHVYIGEIGDEGGGFEAALCHVELDYHSNDLVVEKSAGY